MKTSIRPTIVCLCGSTRFWRQFQVSSLEETMAGKIVLSIGAASGTDDEHFGHLPEEEQNRIKARLDELHLRKIDLADEVLILNVGGYIGVSTSCELRYAQKHGKPVRFLEEPLGEARSLLGEERTEETIEKGLLTLEEAIEHAARYLPEDYELRLEVEQGDASVFLYRAATSANGWKGRRRTDLDTTDMSLPEQVIKAVEMANADEGRKQAI